ncbi:hypothetical protein CDL15_Pgr012874 [Punica granatum]|uniref:Uncharacterized protein n=1 Tax=Punica granatum TaxID=22663 RepID=A0A218XEN1_PUNGR|nr:hypothetical protein CDL15_Pgr012874 [Punica granatum]
MTNIVQSIDVAAAYQSGVQLVLDDLPRLADVVVAGALTGLDQTEKVASHVPNSLDHEALRYFPHV